jgi:hypothetical protein
MLQAFDPGDFLIFQLEAAYGLLRVLAVDENGGDTIWHIAAYSDFFQDVDAADDALDQPEDLRPSIPHVALTNRAFESTQVAKMRNTPLNSDELAAYSEWQKSPEHKVVDRSIRLMLGLR